jgi:hypothetical protein
MIWQSFPPESADFGAGPASSWDLPRAYEIPPGDSRLTIVLARPPRDCSSYVARPLNTCVCIIPSRLGGSGTDTSCFDGDLVEIGGARA